MAFFRYQSLEEGGRRKAATVAVLVSLVVVGALLSGFGHYLLQRTGKLN